MLIHRLVEEAWGKAERGLLTKSLFAKAMQRAKRFFYKRVTHLSQVEMIDLLTDYLRIHGYSVVGSVSTEKIPIITSSFVAEDKMKLHGYGTAAPFWTDAQLEFLERRFPTADYYHIFSVKSLPNETKQKVQIVSADNIVRVLLSVFMFEHFFGEYLNSILTMPNFKDYIYDYMEKEFDLNAEQIEAIHTGLMNYSRLTS